MRVIILKNLGNPYYDKFIGGEFDAVKEKETDEFYRIDEIKTMTLLRKNKYGIATDGYSPTYWTDKEVKVVSY